MKPLNLIRSAIIASAALLATCAAANADALDDIRAAKKIRIAVDLGVAPYGMTDEKMQPTGSDIDTAKLLAKDFGAEFEHVPTTGASRIPSLQSGKADLVISTLSITPERAQVIDFSVPYAPLRTVLAGMKSIPVKDLAGSRRQDGRHNPQHHPRHLADQKREERQGGPLRGRRHDRAGLCQRADRSVHHRGIPARADCQEERLRASWS